MPGLFRFITFALIACLAYLAVWPHIPTIEEEFNLLRQAWEDARKKNFKENDALKNVQHEAPRRQIVAPEAANRTLAPRIEPLILEARLRAQESPEAAMQWLQAQSPGSERLRGMLEVVALWAAEDSESALLWLESNAQGLTRLETLSSGVELWAERAPSEAAAWIDGMANDGSKVSATKSLVKTWAQTQPKEAANWVATLPFGRLRNQAAAALAESWAEIEPQAATVWALAEAEFNGDATLLESTVSLYTRQDPVAAEAFLRELAAATDAPTVLTSHVVARAEEDPAATARWLAEMSPNDPIYSAEHAIGLMKVWVESDSIAASEWLSQQPAGQQRDAAIYGFSESIQRYDPEAAAAWANTIDQPDSRMTRLIDSVRTWAESAPDAAQEWINTATLEPAVRQMLSGKKANSNDRLDQNDAELQFIELQ